MYLSIIVHIIFLFSSDEALDKHQDLNAESADEFDKEMDQELLSKIRLMVSPNIAQATNISQKCATGAKPREEPLLTTGE